MASPRKPRVVNVKLTPYQLRDARARAKGYRGYYDYRAHDNGRIPPGQPRLRGERLKRARGHAASADLVSELREGDLITLIDGVGAIQTGTNKKGEFIYLSIRKRVISSRNGSTREYDLRNLTRPALIELIRREKEAGGVFTPAPSLDQRRIPAEHESEGGY